MTTLLLHQRPTPNYGQKGQHEEDHNPGLEPELRAALTNDRIADTWPHPPSASPNLKPRSVASQRQPSHLSSRHGHGVHRVCQGLDIWFSARRNGRKTGAGATRDPWVVLG